ncbi:hypothetical protein STRDD11_01011 [Streptococcus sp. DD11]|nr:hypothetical protein STRDD11_01011 [Streptococcus sp. DD11]
MVTILKRKFKKVKTGCIRLDSFCLFCPLLASNQQDDKGDKAKNIKEKNAQSGQNLFCLTHQKKSSFLQSFFYHIKINQS